MQKCGVPGGSPFLMVLTTLHVNPESHVAIQYGYNYSVFKWGLIFVKILVRL